MLVSNERTSVKLVDTRKTTEFIHCGKIAVLSGVEDSRPSKHVLAIMSGRPRRPLDPEPFRKPTSFLVTRDAYQELSCMGLSPK